MAKQCLFCPNPADSKEHVWPKWVIEDLKPVQPIRIRFGKTFEKWVEDPEVEIGCVCQKCNSSWMSDIETENKPQISAMINGEAVTLDPLQQKLLTRWATLKAMVVDGSSPKRRIRFYSEEERLQMKPPLRFIPVGTAAWIGRLSVKAFHTDLFDTFGDINGTPRAFHGCVMNIVMGHFIIGVITMHVIPMFATDKLRLKDNPGAWNVNLLDIWPAFGDKSWPPLFSFVLKGATPHHVGRLVRRFRIGEDITT